MMPSLYCALLGDAVPSSPPAEKHHTMCHAISIPFLLSTLGWSGSSQRPSSASEGISPLSLSPGPCLQAGSAGGGSCQQASWLFTATVCRGHCVATSLHPLPFTWRMTGKKQKKIKIKSWCVNIVSIKKINKSPEQTGTNMSAEK